MRTLILFVIFILGLAVYTLFYALPWAAEKIANLIPASIEVQLGEQLAEVYSAEAETNDSANYYMKNFVQELDLDDTYKIEVSVLESKDINAFALPGGKIFIYSSILEKMQSYEELVALLGHEVTHVVNRHSLKSICRSAATNIVIANLFGDVNSVSYGIVSQAEQFKQLDYSRDLEIEADNNGLQIMLENKINPKGMLDLLKLLKEEGAEMPQFMKYLSTHPDTDSRIESIQTNLSFGKEFAKNKQLEAIFKKLKASI